MELYEFQGGDIVDTPRERGIYAWYYRPRVFSKREVEILSKLITTPMSVKTEIGMRYGIFWETDSKSKILHRGKEIHQFVNELFTDLTGEATELIELFFKSLLIPYYAKPLYIGQTENLYQRVYKEHYTDLQKYWETNNKISQYLEEYPDADVQDVLKRFDEKHSFAINARVKGIAPKDMLVCVCPIDLQCNLRNLERMLQILADPICGKE